MLLNDKSAANSIRSVLVIGCGLIGTSLAMAWKKALPSIRICGVDVSEAHRTHVMNTGVFESVHATLPAASFDLVVLATPVDVACSKLPRVCTHATWVMDVCSVKHPLTQTALLGGHALRFAPTHPMAGNASEGPFQATPDLFVGRPWIFISGWPACDVVKPLLEVTGAHMVEVPSAEEHDVIMAAVSHGVHVSSLMTMLAFHQLQSDGQSWAGFTGPGFQDVTRLSASPSSFWVSTLLANQANVLYALDSLSTQLSRFQTALRENDSTALQQLLDEAREAHSQWKGARL